MVENAVLEVELPAGTMVRVAGVLVMLLAPVWVRAGAAGWKLIQERLVWAAQVEQAGQEGLLRGLRAEAAED